MLTDLSCKDEDDNSKRDKGALIESSHNIAKFYLFRITLTFCFLSILIKK